MADIQVGSATKGRLLQSLKSWFRARSPHTAAGVSRAGIGRCTNAAIHVLVVDDNPGNLGATSALLEQCGISALLAADGAEAVALARELDFDLVLMDLQMPVLDGLAATTAIRRHEAIDARPKAAVVAFSGCPATESLLAACGFSGVLCKPCSLDQLEACLTTWCPDYAPCAMGPIDWRASSREQRDGVAWRG